MYKLPGVRKTDGRFPGWKDGRFPEGKDGRFPGWKGGRFPEGKDGRFPG
jgi:hypothetical protein